MDFIIEISHKFNDDHTAVLIVEQKLSPTGMVVNSFEVLCSPNQIVIVEAREGSVMRTLVHANGTKIKVI